MTFDEKALALHLYIVGGVSITRMPDVLSENYGIRIGNSEFNPVLAEYGINYNDRGTGNSRGFSTGQHLGAYSGGFQANDGQVYGVDLSIIKDFMRTYKRKRMNIDIYLDQRFNRGGVTGGFAPSWLGRLIPAAAVILVLFFGGKALIGGIGSIKDKINSKKTSSVSAPHADQYDYSAKNVTAFGDLTNTDGTTDICLIINFKADETDLEGLDEYLLCVNNASNNVPLGIGFNNGGSVNVEIGKSFKMWISSGGYTSEVYRVEVGPVGGTVYFDCTVGEGGRPVFTNTQNLGINIWVEKVG